MFGAPSYISIGDDYDKKIPVSDRLRGRQMMTNPTRRGMTPDVTFDRKLASLALGDKYIDPGTREKQERRQEASRKITPEGFRYTSPSKRSSGLGGYYGCFCEGSPPRHEPDRRVPQKGEAPPRAASQEPRNFLTGPPKKGTFGVPGTTISKGDEYRYISDPYEATHRPREAASSSSAAAAKPTGPVFKGACRRTDVFDAQPNVGVSRIYSLDRPLPARKHDSGRKLPPVTVPFRPPSASKKGLLGTLTKFPEYREDPYDLREKAQREAAAKDRPPVIWKPTSGPKSLPVRSIVFSASALAD
jgi:hypothetical protein